MYRKLNHKKPTVAAWIALLAALLCCGISSPAAPREVKLSVAEKRKLDTFFSNFSEVYLSNFKRGHVTDQMLISFGVMHEEINSHVTKVSAQRVRRLALWYFGVPVHHDGPVPGDDFQRVGYRNGYYTAPPIDDANSAPSRIVHLWNIGKGYYKAEVIIDALYTGEGPDDDIQYTALIQQVGSGARQRYILLEYQGKG
jgi:hypothetical protein